MYSTRILGTGSYLPEKLLTNQDLEKLVDTSDQWIRERTGIHHRHIAAAGQATSDLGYEAALRALKEAQIPASSIDLIIFCTVTGDQPFPSTACMLQAKLGLSHVPSFDLSAACTGFIYGLSIADQFIRTGMYENVLVVGAEVIHPFVDYSDRETCILFGDGAGAFVLGRSLDPENSKIHSTHLRAEGSLAELIHLPAGGSRIPFSQSVLDNKQHLMKMKGREIFKNAVRAMSSCCQEALEKNKVSIEQVDWLIPHQANSRIMEAVADHFKFPKEKVISIIHEMGNTSAATIPVAFDMAKNDGRIRRGQTLLLTAFGAGLTSGSCLLKY